MAKVSVECRAYPSESPEKINSALLKLFPTGIFTYEDGIIKGEGNLETLSVLIRKQKILDTARSQFLKGMSRNHTKTTIKLNKQAATVGKVSFVDYKIVLGTIDVTVEDENLMDIINRIAPETVNGEEVA